jgi:molecular chaperone GrpE
MKKKMKKHDLHVNDETESTVEAVEETQAMADSDDLPVLDTEIPEALVSDAEGSEGDPGDAALAAMQAERDALQDQLLRARAEFDNFRRRVARENEQLRTTAAQALMRDLLPIVDNMERALSHVEDKTDGLALGIEMVLKQFTGVLAARGLETIAAKGEPFNPHVHEALTHQPSVEYPADTVMEEFQRGYRLGDFVLRPTQVVVSSGPPAPAEVTADTPGDRSDDEG